MNEIKKQLDEIVDREFLYKKILPFIVEENFFQVLQNKISFEEFHEKLIQLSSFKSGVGISVSIMAQVNIAGQVLKILSKLGNAFCKILLDEIINGKKIVSLGVSEPNWKGKISNIQSRLTKTEDKYFLSGEKSFFTNGANSDYFILVVKFENLYKLVILDKNKTGIQIETFQLNFAKEATHAKLKFSNIQILETEIFDFDYSSYSENLRFSEMLSLAAIFIGYSNNLLQTLTLETENFDEIEIYKIYFQLDLFKTYILKINSIRDQNENLELKTLFPFGTEFIVEDFYNRLEKNFSKEMISKFDTEFELFKLGDFFNQIYIKKAARKRISRN